MIPHFTVHHQYCERCDSEIYIGYECLMTKDGYFCCDDCLKNHLYQMEGAREVYLTNNKFYRGVE